MSLKFFGRGSGFSDEHTSAYFFTSNKEMVIIDCPISTFKKLKQMDLSRYETIYVLITHTHGDHIGGLSLFVQYSYFTLKKIVTIVTPSPKVTANVLNLLTIEGTDFLWYKHATISEINRKSWFGSCIATEHSPQLEGKCFGYSLYINDVHTVYTGDTCTLKPYLRYLKKGSELYIDTCINDSKVHLKLEDVFSDLIELTQKGVKVHLMHLDDITKAQRIVAKFPDIDVVTVD